MRAMWTEVSNRRDIGGRGTDKDEVMSYFSLPVDHKPQTTRLSVLLPPSSSNFTRNLLSVFFLEISRRDDAVEQHHINLFT